MLRASGYQHRKEECMHTSIVHTATAPVGLTQMAAPQTDRIPGKSRSDHATDLTEVLDRMTINRAKANRNILPLSSCMESLHSPLPIWPKPTSERMPAGCHLARWCRNSRKAETRGCKLSGTIFEGRRYRD